MLRIVLIRPGATDFDLQGRIQGTLDIPLCEQGRAEVQSMAIELKPLGMTALYTSECQSARETAALIGKVCALKVKELDELQNLNQGLWQGMLVDEVKNKQPTVYRQWQEQPGIICPPEGEMIADAIERIEGPIKKISRKHLTGIVGLVIPEPLASVVESHLTHQAIGDLWKADLRTGGWAVIELTPPPLYYRGAEIR